MGYLLHIVVALGVLAAAEQGLGAGVEVPAAVLALALVPHALGWIDRRLLLRGRFRSAEIVYRALSWSPLVLHALALLAFGWAASLERWLGVRPSLLGWPHVSVLLALAPFFAYALLAIDAKARLSDSRLEEIRRTRRFQSRLLLSSVAPFAVFVLLTWAIGLRPGLRANIEHVALWSGAFALALVLLTMAMLPRLLRATWDTEPLPPGRAREALEGFAQGIGFRCRELVQWNTGFQMANAAVVGMGAGRVVLFSDLLLAQLPERELVAVFAHEIGHVVKHHVVVFVAWSLAFFVGMDFAITALGLESEWAGAAVLCATLGAWYLGFGLLSRRTELDADLYSVAVTGDPEAMTGALERVGSPHTRALGSWRHFSTARRIEFLRRAQVEPALGLRLQRRLRWIGFAGVVVGVLALAAETWNLARTYREDRVRAELALGNVYGAAEQLHGVPDPDPELVRWIALANQGPYQNAQPELLRAYADQARESGNLALAYDLYQLARLRGVPDLAARIDALAEQLRTGSR